MDPAQEKVPTAPTSNLSTALASGPEINQGEELWPRVFLGIFIGLGALTASLFAYFYFQRPESWLAKPIEDALLRTEHASVALCLYYIKTLQYNVRMLIALRFLGMFMGALSILLGALFLLKGIETSYQFNLHSDRASSSLNTSSPGLVLITLGVVLVALPQFHDQELVSSNLASCGQLYQTPISAPVSTPVVAPASGPPSFDGGVPDLLPATPRSQTPGADGGQVGSKTGSPSPELRTSHPRHRNRHTEHAASAGSAESATKPE